MLKLSDINKEIYKPGDVAKILGVTIRTVQNYDEQGILKFERNNKQRNALQTRPVYFTVFSHSHHK